MGHEQRTGEPVKAGDEPDALTGWRRFIKFRPGVRKAAKTAYNRRVRRRRIEIDEPDRDSPT
jgi:hypothetical protein